MSQANRGRSTPAEAGRVELRRTYATRVPDGLGDHHRYSFQEINSEEGSVRRDSNSLHLVGSQACHREHLGRRRRLGEMKALKEPSRSSDQKSGRRETQTPYVLCPLSCLHHRVG